MRFLLFNLFELPIKFNTNKELKRYKIYLTERKNVKQDSVMLLRHCL